MIQIGKIFAGRYKIIQIGRGGMADVTRSSGFNLLD